MASKQSCDYMKVVEVYVCLYCHHNNYVHLYWKLFAKETEKMLAIQLVI